MWEVILGIIIGLGYAMAFPSSIEKLRNKCKKTFNIDECEHEDKSARRKRYRDDHE